MLELVLVGLAVTIYLLIKLRKEVAELSELLWKVKYLTNCIAGNHDFSFHNPEDANEYDPYAIPNCYYCGKEPY